MIADIILILCIGAHRTWLPWSRRNTGFPSNRAFRYVHIEAIADCNDADASWCLGSETAGEWRGSLT